MLILMLTYDPSKIFRSMKLPVQISSSDAKLLEKNSIKTVSNLLNSRFCSKDSFIFLYSRFRAQTWQPSKMCKDYMHIREIAHTHKSNEKNLPNAYQIINLHYHPLERNKKKVMLHMQEMSLRTFNFTYCWEEPQTRHQS